MAVSLVVEAPASTSGNSHQKPNQPLQEDQKPQQNPQIQDQSSRLPLSRLILVCASLILAVFLTSLEQTSVSTVLPTIAAELGSERSVSWIGTAFLIGNTASQTILGRLSDIFGRKPIHLASLAIFFIGSLLCGFSKSMAQLIAFRGIAGFGGGGVLVCVMAIMSDVVSLKNRGKIQGVVGLGTILANGIGPTFGGIFAEHGWRWIFWVVCPPTALAFLQCLLWLPLRPVQGDKKKMFKQIDFLGIFCQLVAVIFILIPISGGGSSFAWNSAEAISFLVIGFCFFCAFLLVEAKFATLPIVPLDGFRDRSLALLYIATFGTGAYFFTSAYYLPMYFQSVLGKSPLVSSAYLQALTLTQVVTIFATGFFLAWLGRYNMILWTGYTIYLIGSGLGTRFTQSTNTGYIIGILVMESFGMGLTLQTSLIAMQAVAKHEDRAVVTGIRNMARFIGGSFGLAISSGLLNASKTNNQNNTLEPISPHEYEIGLKRIWWMLFAIGVLVFVVGFGVKDVGLHRDEQEQNVSMPISDDLESHRDQGIEMERPQGA